MSADVNAIVEKIVADAEQKVRTDLRNISSKIKTDFTNKAKEVVMLYYAHYSPKIYNRTGNLQGGVVDDYLSFVVLNGHAYGAWIQFNDTNMADYSIGNKDAVVSNFMHGIHGKPKIFMESFPAIDLMDVFQYNYKSTLDGYFTNLGYNVRK